jgi:SpoVK/Ycf46/Vps4 family AAA+-type ATPase
VNKIEGLPDELLRKGRFDEIFYVGLPSEREREEIFKIQIKKYHRNPKNFDTAELAAKSDGFSGAEIEECVKSGLYLAFDREKELSTDHILHGIITTVPLSKSRAEQLDNMAKWAKANARNASTVEDDDGKKNRGRAVDVE